MAARWPNDTKGGTMRISRVSLFAAILAIIGTGLFPVIASASEEAIETGRLLAILLDSGRVTVGANQALINDPDKGDKGFTPEVFEKQLTEKFKDRAKVDLANLKNEKVPAMAKELLPKLVDASKKTV